MRKKFKQIGSYAVCEKRTTCYMANEIIEVGQTIGRFNKKIYCKSCFKKLRSLHSQEVNYRANPYGRMTQ